MYVMMGKKHLGRSYPLVTNLLLLFLFSEVAVNVIVAVFLDIREVDHWISGGAFMADLGNYSPNTKIFKWVDPWTPISRKESITWSLTIRKEVAGMSPEDSHLSPHLSTSAVTCWDDMLIRASDDMKLQSTDDTRNRFRETAAGWNDGEK